MITEFQADIAGRLTPDEFRTRCYLASTPCLFKGAAADWDACRRWTQEYLSQLYGDKMVDLTMSDGESFKYSTSRSGKGILRTYFKRALELISSDFEDTGLRYYLMQKSIPAEFPELMADLREPAWLEDPNVIGARNIWIGNGGNVTNLHYDLSNNFLIQVAGTKVFTLFSPLDYDYLYAAERTARSNLSMVDPDDPDMARFPLYAGARPIRVVVSAGDILYMPPFWWHHVRSNDFTISVNYWWRAHVRQCVNKPAMDILHRAYEAGTLPDRLGELDISGCGQLRDLPFFYLESGHLWAAVLSAMALLGIEGTVTDGGANVALAPNGLQRQWAEMAPAALARDNGRLDERRIGMLLRSTLPAVRNFHTEKSHL